jgi:hypothetical protein
MRRPRTIPSRAGPRKPGQTGRGSGAARGEATAAGALPAAAARGFSDGFAAGAFGAVEGGGLAGAAAGGSGVAALFGAEGSADSRASSSSSGVGVHRQWRSKGDEPVVPLVRTSVKVPAASSMAATSEARRGPAERRRVAAAHATRARARTGMDRK